MGTSPNSKSRQIKIGDRFNRLEVVGAMTFVQGKNARYASYLCRCECGNSLLVKACNLLAGKTSCGCFIGSRQAHGSSKERIYQIWTGMNERCRNPKTAMYHRYGGRGICVCNEWSNSFVAFKEWSIANGYAPTLSIDRIDNDGNYEPSNCRWVTKQEQDCNKSTNRLITAFGETKCLTEWHRDKRCSMPSVQGIRSRLSAGLSPEDAISTPPLPRSANLRKKS